MDRESSNRYEVKTSLTSRVEERTAPPLQQQGNCIRGVKVDMDDLVTEIQMIN